MASQTEILSNNKKIKIAQVPVIDYDKLLSGNQTEISRLVDICQSLGFFYLNLNGNGQSLLDDSRNAFKFMEKYFDQPLDVKLQDTRQSVTHGLVLQWFWRNQIWLFRYTPTGTYTGAKREERDCYETLKVSRGDCK